VSGSTTTFIKGSSLYDDVVNESLCDSVAALVEIFKIVVLLAALAESNDHDDDNNNKHKHKIKREPRIKKKFHVFVILLSNIATVGKSYYLMLKNYSGTKRTHSYK
jgi:hypothetical protein